MSTDQQLALTILAALALLATGTAIRLTRRESKTFRTALFGYALLAGIVYCTILLIPVGFGVTTLWIWIAEVPGGIVLLGCLGVIFDRL